MTLGTHAVVGGSVAMLFPSHPVVAFCAGFFSHFILDSLPHWDYKILSSYANPEFSYIEGESKIDKYFFYDLLRVSIDIFIGLVVIYFIWQPINLFDFYILALGIIGGVLPDFLQFVYKRFSHQPMIAIQAFHKFIHTDWRIKNRPVVGLFLQIIVVIAVVSFVKFAIKF